MRAVKWTAYVVGGAVGLIVLALLAIVLFVDPNEYRDDIERLVEQKTGRQLTLGGELKLSVFPWLALQVGPASLGDAPGFGPEPFAAIEEARVGVRLWPLLRGKVEVGHVRLGGARLRLITDAKGRHNWADLGSSGESQAPEQAGGPLQVPTIAGLEVTDAAVSFEDRRKKSRQVVRDFNLKTGRLESAKPFDLQTSFVFEATPALALRVQLATEVTADLAHNVHRLAEPEIDLTLSGQGYPAQGVGVQVRAKSLQADLARKLYALNSMSLQTTWKGEGLPAAGVPIALMTQDLNADLAAQRLQLTGLQLEAAGAHLAGSLSGVEILDAPSLQGPLKLEPVSLREWLPKLGIKLPQTRDPEVLKRLSFSGTLHLTRSAAELDDILMQLDDTTVKGRLGLADFKAKALRFELQVDRINADRYLPASPQQPGQKAPADQAPPSEIPLDLLRALNARGQLVLGEAIFAGMTFTQLRLGLNAREGVVRLHPAESSLYGGRYRGDIGIDASGNLARVTLDEHLSGVDFAPLFKDLFKTQRVAGRGSANLKLAGAGRTTADIMKTLDGTLDFNVADGALEGADLWYEIRRARALLKREPLPERSGPARTTFSALSGTGVMDNGVLTNRDLKVAMQYLRITGEGTVDIPGNALDYRLLATVLKLPPQGAQTAQMQDMIDAEIPVKVTGALNDPKVRPDLAGYAKGKVKERAEKERGKLEEKLKEKLGDKLRNLFGD